MITRLPGILELHRIEDAAFAAVFLAVSTRYIKQQAKVMSSTLESSTETWFRETAEIVNDNPFCYPLHDSDSDNDAASSSDPDDAWENLEANANWDDNDCATNNAPTGTPGHASDRSNFRDDVMETGLLGPVEVITHESPLQVEILS